MRSFRRARLLLLVLLAAIVVVVGIAYRSQRASLARNAPKRPALLPAETSASAAGWTWSKTDGDRTIVEVRARSFVRVDQRLDLEGVELKLFSRDGRTYDLVRSRAARFRLDEGALYSDGEVNITMGHPANGGPPGRLISIRSSGVTFESATGIARTDRHAAFTFENSEGACVGAQYDPMARELIMRSQVELTWRGRGPDSVPMKLEAGELYYRERDSLVELRGRSRLTRGTAVLEATGNSYITLKEGLIERVEAVDAHGTERSQGRDLDYSAGRLWIEFTPRGEVRKASGSPNARLLAVTATARTSVSADRIELEFDPGKDESPLRQALAMGGATVESVPVVRPGAPVPDTRKVASDTVLMRMRPGGREIERMETHAPGRLEFIPNAPGRRRRILDANRMSIDYASANVPKLFSAFSVATRTEPAREGLPPLLTWSDNFRASFDARGELVRIEQWDGFRYEEGARRGRADRAVLDELAGRITMTGGARFQDPAGSITADRIELAQQSGDVTAAGNVISTRAQDGKGASSAMLASDAPLEGRAQRLTTSGRNSRLHYEGDAVLWQGANRIAADVIDIDREKRTLSARGNVRTRFVDRQGKSQPGRAPGFVVVEAAALVYTEGDRMARYTGGARLSRPGLTVEADGIRAFLNGPEVESSLDRAYADGSVSIAQQDDDTGRSVRATSEHAEYYAASQKLVLTGGRPVLEDSAKGTTAGRELIYFAAEDRLLVNGAETAPAVSRIRRSK
ncbi:MAG: LptA/OstA family protein [bacterium]|jgi:lipopolysaccharide export system protein LptA